MLDYSIKNSYFRTLKSFGMIFILMEIFLFFLHLDIYFFTAATIFIYQLLLLFHKIGEAVPIRNLVGTMFSLNYLLSPVLMYSWLNPYVIEGYVMRGDPDTYFKYAIPCILLLILGLNFKKKESDEILNEKKIINFLQHYPNLPLQLIILGVVSQLVAPLVPPEITSIFYALAYFKYAGLFLSFWNGKHLNILYLFLTYGILLIQSLTSSLFNDFLNLLFFLSFFLAIKYKPSGLTKFFGLIIGLSTVVFIQNIKFSLRSQVTNSISDLSKLDDIIEESTIQYQNKGSNERIGDIIMRLDQGWVTTNVMENYNNGSFELQKGKHALLIIESSFLPRLLVPDKLDVSDRPTFTKYTGKILNEHTSIAVGILGEGFIDFGYYGFISVFLFGFILNQFIKIYHRLDQKYPLAKIFTPVAFFIAVRPDTDTINALGSLIKITFLIWILLILLNKNYKQLDKT